MAALYVDGWSDVLHASLDIVGVDMQPVREVTFWPLLYFIAWVFVGAFFFFNMITGSVVATFDQLYKTDEGTVLLTEEQIRWVQTQVRMQAFETNMHAFSVDGKGVVCMYASM